MKKTGKSKGGRPRLNEEEKLKHKVETTLNEKDYTKLRELCKRSGKSESYVVRKIICRRATKNEDASLFQIQCNLGEGLSSLKKAGNDLHVAVEEIQSLKNAEDIRAHLMLLTRTIENFTYRIDQFYKVTQDILVKLVEKTS